MSILVAFRNMFMPLLAVFRNSFRTVLAAVFKISKVSRDFQRSMFKNYSQDLQKTTN
jgi:hypothetical protein